MFKWKKNLSHSSFLWYSTQRYNFIKIQKIFVWKQNCLRTPNDDDTTKDDNSMIPGTPANILGSYNVLKTSGNANKIHGWLKSLFLLWYKKSITEIDAKSCYFLIMFCLNKNTSIIAFVYFEQNDINWIDKIGIFWLLNMRRLFIFCKILE